MAHPTAIREPDIEQQEVVKQGTLVPGNVDCFHSPRYSSSPNQRNRRRIRQTNIEAAAFRCCSVCVSSGIAHDAVSLSALSQFSATTNSPRRIAPISTRGHQRGRLQG